MTEVDEITDTLGRHLATMTSAALGVAQLAQQRRAERARRAAHHSEANRDATSRQLDAERELAAAQWSRATDPQTAASEPGQVAQAWASARAWEPFDERAGAAREQLEDQLKAWGIAPEAGNLDRDPGDDAAMAMMLQRGAEHHLRDAANETSAQQEDGRHIAGAPSEARTSGVQDPDRAAAAHHGQAAGALERDAAADAVDVKRALGRADSQDQTVVDVAGGSYSSGGEPAVLAGQGYPQPAASVGRATRQPRRAPRNHQVRTRSREQIR